ncbi:hypothetical protein [Rhizobium multihospitium]|uniref:HEPN AbiU2-like domain-containing protein n=1 Tax=Rhizobium multihospitium TaxID=410764 RepID=A0A1C3V747_9HYPH|nr:hypothetical protein [Rhizobium multihospitium]SCB23508.1 hypothetical protein GA0061103_3336 [Rhizobium multihospitium]
MTAKFQVIQLQLDQEALTALSATRRNQLVGCMHAHNELTFLNRLLMFSLNGVGDGDLHDSLQGTQMWTVMQLLAGKLFETWKIIDDRFLKANPPDPLISNLSGDQKQKLDSLIKYFGTKTAALRIIRDKTAFHYDKINLSEAVDILDASEGRVYLAQHPVNTFYQAGSALVFHAIFMKIAEVVAHTSSLSSAERIKRGSEIAMDELNSVNEQIHDLLYYLISNLMEEAFSRPLHDIEQIRIPIEGAPKPNIVALPMFLDVGGRI